MVAVEEEGEGVNDDGGGSEGWDEGSDRGRMWPRILRSRDGGPDMLTVFEFPRYSLPSQD